MWNPCLLSIGEPTKVKTVYVGKEMDTISGVYFKVEVVEWSTHCYVILFILWQQYIKRLNVASC